MYEINNILYSIEQQTLDHKKTAFHFYVLLHLAQFPTTPKNCHDSFKFHNYTNLYGDSLP